MNTEKEKHRYMLSGKHLIKVILKCMRIILFRENKTFISTFNKFKRIYYIIYEIGNAFS